MHIDDIHTNECAIVEKNHIESAQCFKLDSKNGSNATTLEEITKHLSYLTPNSNPPSNHRMPTLIRQTCVFREHEIVPYCEIEDINFIDEEEERDYVVPKQSLKQSVQDTHLELPSIRYLAVKVKPQMDILHELTNQHDQHYLSVSFGEDVIKEMVMSSAYGTSFNAQTTMFAYRVMIHRVHRVARNFSRFNVLPLEIQDVLLRKNSDLIVSLHGAAFFQFQKEGLEQILGSLGYDDHLIARSIISEMKQSHKANYDDYKGIDYKNFNSIQEKRDNTSTEIRYNNLLSKIGSITVINQMFLKLLVYIILLTSDFDNDDEVIIDKRTKDYIDKSQKELITILEGCVFENYSTKMAKTLFCGLLECLTDLKELCYIKKNRRSAQISSHTLKTLIGSGQCT